MNYDSRSNDSLHQIPYSRISKTDVKFRKKTKLSNSGFEMNFPDNDYNRIIDFKG